MNMLVLAMAPVITVGVGDVGLWRVANHAANASGLLVPGFSATNHKGMLPEITRGGGRDNRYSSHLAVSKLQINAQRSGRLRSSFGIGSPDQVSDTKEMFAKGFDQIRAQLKQNTITVVVVCVSLLLLAIWSLRGLGTVSNTSGQIVQTHDSAEPLGRDKQVVSFKPDMQNGMSILALTLLTSWKFWVGFFGATWMPFLMAKEGLALLPGRQSVFMGIGKLIFGTSVLLNPVFGLISDQSVFSSRWSSRRLWLIIGVTISALGVTTVKAASSFGDPTSYLVATALWMLGESIADTTVETLVPEMVPPEQYDLASGIRSMLFLFGGVCGYLALIICRDFDFHWIYSAYLVLLVCCAFPTVASIREEEKSRGPVSLQRNILNSIVEAYIGPTYKYGPDFARACGIQFVFSLGSASIFFVMLMMRDVCGVTDEKAQQTHFSVVSMLFMLAAAVSSVVAAWLAEKVNRRQSGYYLSRRNLLLGSMILFGLATLGLPAAYHFSGEARRLCWFYFAGTLLGWAFGAVYALFQSCMWTLLPADTSDVANAMGFATLCKCLGIGLGNFAAGFILDYFSLGPREYAIGGYWSVSVTCSVFVLLSAALAELGVEGLD